MYAWQTLALAKAQYRGNSTKAQAAVKDLLYLIGLPHFPDPVVFKVGDGMAVRLRWDVEGRALLFDVDQLGVVSYNQFHTDDDGPVDSGTLDLSSSDGRNEVCVMVGWLLFGELPPDDAKMARLKTQKLLNAKQRSLKEVANDVVDGLKR